MPPDPIWPHKFASIWLGEIKSGVVVSVVVISVSVIQSVGVKERCCLAIGLLYQPKSEWELPRCRRTDS
jgi:hypothetical protein